jgi:hypothetical protein
MPYFGKVKGKWIFLEIVNLGDFLLSNQFFFFLKIEGKMNVFGLIRAKHDILYQIVYNRKITCRRSNDATCPIILFPSWQAP